MTVADVRSCANEILLRARARVILVAGASCSGKTVLSRALVTAFAEAGTSALHVTLDDYYVGAARNPRDENGDFDFETPDALDASRVSADLDSLAAGRPTRLHRYDFATHEAGEDAVPTQIAPHGRIVLEGIHAFNPKMSALIPESAKCRVLVNPRPPVAGVDSDTLRLVRRLVRDERLRAIAPAETFRMWPQVLAGERRWLQPFRAAADIEYDSAFPGEFPDLARAAFPLVLAVCRARPDDEAAAALLRTLGACLPDEMALHDKRRKDNES